ncbi:hypothetical protein FACS189490_02750 [Clostridia bacterium]|nr:hypothetical protein FACS189490_02750 [Clostridia bacterium]
MYKTALKRIIISIILAATALTMTAAAEYKDAEYVYPEVVFNGSFIRVEQPIYLDAKNNELLVPVTPFFMLFGFLPETFEYDESVASISAKTESGLSIRVFANTSYYYVNSVHVPTLLHSRLIDGDLYVPLRLLTELVKADLYYENGADFAEIVWN